MILHRIALMLGLSCLAVTTALSQKIQDTSIGKLGERLITVLNSNDVGKQREFIENTLDSRAQNEGIETWLEKFNDLYARTGGVVITSMEPGRDRDEVRMTIKSNRDGTSFEVATKLSIEGPAMLIGFLYRSIGSVSSATWPRGSLSEQSIINEIEKHVEHAVKQDQFSGAVMIARKGQTIFNKGYGFSNKENLEYNTPATQFNIGSLNKMFTSVAIAQLVQAGKLSFETTLSDVLSTYPDGVVAKKITIHQLLTHTSGLGDFFKPAFFEHREKYVALSSYVPLFSNDSLLFRPGTHWTYSNAGYILLGLVIEKLSSETYFDYVQHHICDPAGMTSTGFFERDAVMPNRAIGYTHEEDDRNHKMPRQANTAMLPIKGSSAGGGYSTTHDLFLFEQALTTNRLLTKKFTDIVMTGKVNDGHADSQYGYGFIDRTRNNKHIIGHNGGGPGISAGMYILPANDYIVIVLGNYSPPSADALAAEISEFLTEH